MRDTLINGLMFNVSWFAIVSTQSPVLAPLVACAHLVLHFLLMGKGLVEVRLILAVTLFGVVLDQLLFSLGVFNTGGVASAAPVWISCLWPVLATTFMHAFSGLRDRPWLASIFGAVGGAGSYIAGTGLTEVQFGSPTWGPLVMATLWALLFPTLLLIAYTFVTNYEEPRHAWS